MADSFRLVFPFGAAAFERLYLTIFSIFSFDEA